MRKYLAPAALLAVAAAMLMAATALATQPTGLTSTPIASGTVDDIDIQTKTVADLTPFDGVAAQLVGVSHHYLEEVIVGLNHRHPQWHDLYRLNI